MVETHGLTHISFSVADPERSLAFYPELFGVRAYHREAGSIQALGPGLPYLYLADPDGYTIEIWYEPEQVQVG